MILYYLARDRKVKVKNFPRAKIDDMYDYIKPLLKKCPDNTWWG